MVQKLIKSSQPAYIEIPGFKSYSLPQHGHIMQNGVRAMKLLLGPDIFSLIYRVCLPNNRCGYWLYENFAREDNGETFKQFPTLVSRIREAHKETGTPELAYSMWLNEVAAWRLTRSTFSFHPEILSKINPIPKSQLKPSDLIRLPYWAIFLELPHVKIKLEKHESIGYAHFYGVLFFEHFTHVLKHNLETKKDKMTDGVVREIMISCPFIPEWKNKPTTYDSFGIFPAGIISEAHDQIIYNISDIEAAYDLDVIIACLKIFLDSIPCNPKESKSPYRFDPIKTKHGWRWLPSTKTFRWYVGGEIGEAIIQAKQQDKKNGNGTHASPCPHIRRAHWHTYLIGPSKNIDLKDRKRLLKWVPPIPVAMPRSYVEEQ